jgi:hypothetical protein
MKKLPPKGPAELLAAIEGANAPEFGGVRIRSRSRLPHWEVKSGLSCHSYAYPLTYSACPQRMHIHTKPVFRS